MHGTHRPRSTAHAVSRATGNRDGMPLGAKASRPRRQGLFFYTPKAARRPGFFYTRAKKASEFESRHTENMRMRSAIGLGQADIRRLTLDGKLRPQGPLPLILGVSRLVWRDRFRSIVLVALQAVYGSSAGSFPIERCVSCSLLVPGG